MWYDADGSEELCASTSSSVEYLYELVPKQLAKKLDKAKLYVNSVLDDIVDKAKSYSRLEFKEILETNSPICALSHESQSKIRLASKITMQVYSEIQSLSKQHDFGPASSFHVANITDSLLERTQRMFVSKDLMKYLVDLRQLINEIIDALEVEEDDDNDSDDYFTLSSSEDILTKNVIPQLETGQIKVTDSLIRDCRKQCSKSKSSTLDTIKKFCSDICASKRIEKESEHVLDENNYKAAHRTSRPYMRQRNKGLSLDTQNILEKNFIVVKEFSKELKRKTKKSMRKALFAKLSTKFKNKFRRKDTARNEESPNITLTNINNELRQLKVLLTNDVLPNIHRLCQSFSMENMPSNLSIIRNFGEDKPEIDNNVNVLTVQAYESVFPFRNGEE